MDVSEDTAEVVQMKQTKNSACERRHRRGDRNETNSKRSVVREAHFEVNGESIRLRPCHDYNGIVPHLLSRGIWQSSAVPREGERREGVYPTNGQGNCNDMALGVRDAGCFSSPLHVTFGPQAIPVGPWVLVVY